MTTMIDTAPTAGPVPAARGLWVLAAAFAAAVVGLWGPWSLGLIVLPSAFGAFPWLMHELVYGCVPLVVAGVGWRERSPGRGVMALVAVLWAAGRITVVIGFPGPPATAAVAMGLPLVVVCARQNVVSRPLWVGAGVLLLAMQATVHWQVWRFGSPDGMSMWGGLLVALAGLLGLTRCRVCALVVTIGLTWALYGVWVEDSGWIRAAATLSMLGGLASTFLAATLPATGRAVTVSAAVGVACLSVVALDRSWTMVLTPAGWICWVGAFLALAVLVWRR